MQTCDVITPINYDLPGPSKIINNMKSWSTNELKFLLKITSIKKIFYFFVHGFLSFEVTCYQRNTS